MPKPLALVTGASTGIGFELAKCCAKSGYDLIVVADEPQIKDAAKVFEGLGADVDFIESDLSQVDGVDRLLDVVGSRPVDALLANAGRGLGKGFFDQDWNEIRRVIDTNVTGTVYLIQKIGERMRGAQQRENPDHRLDRRFHAGRVSGGL